MNRRIVTLAAVSLLFAGAAVAAERDGPRLKFRDRGPPCMCAGGLSEEDIRRAERQRTEQGERRSGSGTERLDGDNAGIDSKRRGED